MDLSCFSIPVIPFFPQEILDDISWTCAQDVIKYLIRYPAERMRILIEVQRRSGKKFCHFIIYHPLMTQDLRLNTNDNDLTFVKALQVYLLIETSGGAEPFSI
jgi:hypothetical protein